MKFLRVLGAVVLAASSVLAIAPSASAAVTVTGGTFVGLNPTGDTVKFQLSNFPSTGGLYIQECLLTAGRPTAAQCNPASAIWVSTATGATYKPTDLITVPVVGSFGSVNCLVQGCGLFFRMDHTSPTNFSEDRFMALTFTGQVVKPLDEITTKVNGVVLTAAGANLPYKTPTKLEISTKSGTAVTIKVTGDCSITGMTITALKGSGLCDVAVTSMGNASYTGVTVHYPMTMVPGVQTISFNPPKQIVGTKLLFLGKATTNMGEKPTITAAPSNVCALKSVGANIMVVAKSKGTCTITITAPAKEGWYTALNKSYTLSVKSSR